MSARYKYSFWNLRRQVKSFSFAFSGIRVFIQEEVHALIHTIAALMAVIMGFVYAINPLEWVAVILCIGSVVALEILNSAVERICDLISMDFHRDIKKIKDLGSAAVLVMSVVSIVVALLIFLPKILG